MYSLKLNHNLDKILLKYNENKLNNFLLISKIKKYILLKKNYISFKEEHFENYRKIIMKINEKILEIGNIIKKEEMYKINMNINLKNLMLIKINKITNHDIILLNYSSMNLYNKKLISQLYKNRNIFFNKLPITLLNINKLKVKYRNYMLTKVKQVNEKKKEKKNKIRKICLEIKNIEENINTIRQKKIKLYETNNIIFKNKFFETKEIYDLKKQIILKKENRKLIKNNKININKNSKFELINLDEKNYVLPIINNNNIFKYNLQQIFIKKIKSDLDCSNEIISNLKKEIEKYETNKEKYNNLLKLKVIDNILKNKYVTVQHNIKKLESEIIRDFLVLNRKK